MSKYGLKSIGNFELGFFVEHSCLLFKTCYKSNNYTNNDYDVLREDIKHFLGEVTSDWSKMYEGDLTKLRFNSGSGPYFRDDMRKEVFLGALERGFCDDNPENFATTGTIGNVKIVKTNKSIRVHNSFEIYLDDLLNFDIVMDAIEGLHFRCYGVELMANQNFQIAKEEILKIIPKVLPCFSEVKGGSIDLVREPIYGIEVGGKRDGKPTKEEAYYLRKVSNKNG